MRLLVLGRFSFDEFISLRHFWRIWGGKRKGGDSGVARGVPGCGPHRATLARRGKRAKIVFKITLKFRLQVS